MIVTLCGSARFEQDFKDWNERLTLKGHTVFSLAVYPSDKDGEKNWYTDNEKKELDAAHFRKIDASDAIFVLNRDGYIGESTRNEIGHAWAQGKQIVYAYRGMLPSGEHIPPLQTACPYRGCFDPLVKRPPCALCYE